MSISALNPFKGRQYSGEVILMAVRWYLRYPLAYQHVSELLAERGLAVDASCIWRWVQAYAVELSKRCWPHLKATRKSYRVDETYIKVKGEEKYLYRAVDSAGQTIYLLLTARRDAAAAMRFFLNSVFVLNPFRKYQAVADDNGTSKALSQVLPETAIPRSEKNRAERSLGTEKKAMIIVTGATGTWAGKSWKACWGSCRQNRSG